VGHQQATAEAFRQLQRQRWAQCCSSRALQPATGVRVHLPVLLAEQPEGLLASAPQGPALGVLPMGWVAVRLGQGRREVQ